MMQMTDISQNEDALEQIEGVAVSAAMTISAGSGSHPMSALLVLAKSCFNLMAAADRDATTAIIENTLLGIKDPAAHQQVIDTEFEQMKRLISSYERQTSGGSA